MIHTAYIPVYMSSIFLARAGGRVNQGSTRGHYGPKKLVYVSGV